MIREAIERSAFLHFGFNKIEITVYRNEPIELWQDTILNENYTHDFYAVGATKITETANYLKFKYSTLGVKNVIYISELVGKAKPQVSNSVTINVVE